MPNAGFKKTIRVLLVDDHPIVRFGFATIIDRQPDMEVCGETESSEQAMELVSQLKPDVVLIDLNLREQSGVGLCKELARRSPGASLLVVSAYEEELHVDAIVQSGGKGYVHKAEATEKLVEGIRTVLSGQLYFSPAAMHRLVARSVDSERAVPSPTAELSERELEVFLQIGRGMSTQQIADEMQLSPKTIESYRENLKRKLRLKSGTHLTRYAMKWVLDNPPQDGHDPAAELGR